MACSLPVLLGDFQYGSDIKANVDYTSENIVRETVQKLMSVKFFSLVLRDKSQSSLRERLFAHYSSMPTLFRNPLSFSNMDNIVINERKGGFPFFRVLELEKRLTIEQIKRIQEKLKTMNLLTKIIPKSEEKEAGKGVQSLPKLKSTLVILTSTPYIITENCFIGNNGYGPSGKVDLIVGKPSQTTNIHFTTSVSVFPISTGRMDIAWNASSQPCVTALALSEMTGYEILPHIVFNESDDTFMVYIYISELDSLITTSAPCSLFSEKNSYSVYPNGLIFLALLFLLKDELWVREDIEKLKPHVTQCGWKEAIAGSQCKYDCNFHKEVKGSKTVHDFQYDF